MTTRMTVGAISIAVAAINCPGSSPYLKTAGEFADTTTKSTKTITGAIDFNHQMCRERAMLDYLQHRVEKTNYSGTPPAPVYWSDWYSQWKPTMHDGKPGPTWQDQCKAIQISDAIVNRAVGALAAYADALSTVAGHDYSGKDVGAIGTDVSALIGAIPKSTPSKATDAIKALGGDKGPLAQLGGALKTAYAAQQVKTIVHEAHTPTQQILGALEAYVKAVGAEETEWELDAAVALNSIDGALGPQKEAKGEAPRPLEIVQFYELASKWDRDAARNATKRDALLDALNKLKGAEQKLEDAQGNDAAPQLADVLGLVLQVLNDVAVVQAAAQDGGTST